MKKYWIWTDGASKGNPGKSGVGYLIRDENGAETEFSAHEPHSTNNKMELTAAILALAAITEPSEVVLTTDSEYVKNGITKWIHGWKKNGWKNAKRQPVKNKDLWVLLDEHASRHQMEWCWVKAHNDDPENERVDTLASDACYE